MNKHQPKPYDKNEHLFSPAGMFGTPPDAHCCCLCPGCCVMVKRMCMRRIKDTAQ